MKAGMDQRYAHLGLVSLLGRQAGAPEDAAASQFAQRLRLAATRAGQMGLEPAAIHLAAELASFEPQLDYLDRWAVVVLIAATLAALEQGSTRLPLSDSGDATLARMARLLIQAEGQEPGAQTQAELDGITERIGRMLTTGALGNIVGTRADEYRPLIYLPPYLYHQRILAAETAAADLIAARLAGGPLLGPAMEPSLARAIDEVIAHPPLAGSGPMVLSAEQIDAVAQGARGRLTLIEGGPGTGKTSVVVALLRVLARLGIGTEEIAVAAPTGKAAFRLGEAIRQGLGNFASTIEQELVQRCAPATIHRLLGYSPSRHRFRHHRANPLRAAAVIIDESSMLDLVLLERLLSAVPPDARLILLGDADQLPSVSAGAIFRDLVAAARQAAPSHRFSVGLTHSYRMDEGTTPGRAILSVAQAINRGDGALVKRLMSRRRQASQLSFEGVEWLEGGADQSEALLRRWLAEQVATDEIRSLAQVSYRQTPEGFDPAATVGLNRLFQLLAAGRILCLTRVLATGASAINSRLHQEYLEGASSWAPEMAPGEPVMVTQNDYERMLFNGDQGVVVSVRGEGGSALPMAVFARGQGFVAFHLEALRGRLELCYATTVHKAQGSEFERVVLLLPRQNLPILSREMLYTALSRSRRGVVLVGDEALLDAALLSPLERFTGLGETLVARLGGNDRPSEGSVQ
jgi:exodeoxyribonuclease V alpha subunit